jgi:alanyl-tRNA synthetase
VSFAIGDGALPSNEGRGYVLRRLLRRAVRFAKQININRPFMYDLVPVVAEIMVDFYPEVKAKTEFIQKVVKNEEERFHETLNEGLSILSTIIKKQKAAGNDEIPGADVFRLYDTYGFPAELTEEYAEEEGMKVDHEGFEKEMEGQRERARSARQDTGSMQVQGGVLGDITVESNFVGYDDLETQSTVSALVLNNEIVETVEKGNEFQFILDTTPFYAESGGQIGDQGVLECDGVKVLVKEVKKAPNGQNLHTAVVEEGTLRTGAAVKAIVSSESRQKVEKNHTATHLLHRALKDVLGEHVNQAGSLVEPDRLRFDFSHFGSVSEEEIEKIESIVNEKVWQGLNVMTQNKSLSDAKAMGAMALFGEKYGENVRVVSIGSFSLELCGGCHVSSTSEIGLFKIVSESGIGAGTRRMEAVTGENAYRLLNDQVLLLKQVSQKLKSNPRDVNGRVDGLLTEIKELQRENESLSAKLSNIEAGSLTDRVKDVDGIKVLTANVSGQDMNGLRNMMDDLKQKLESGIIVLGTAQGEKVNVIAGVTKDLVEKGYHAGKLIKEVASRCGGGGGGRPDMAQAGGKDPEKLDGALQFVEEWVKSV